MNKNHIMNLLNFAENGKGRSPSIKAKITHSKKKRKKKKKSKKYLIGLLEEKKLKWRKRLGH
jgi:hypothetical protein